MIVDTSAIAAIALGEAGWTEIRDALWSDRPIIPAPVLTELQLALAGRGLDVVAGAAALVEGLVAAGAAVAPFEHHHGRMTGRARELFGKGNGCGGLLNFGDLMVYAIAKDCGEALLCTGRDFASTDLPLHAASRIDP